MHSHFCFIIAAFWQTAARHQAWDWDFCPRSRHCVCPSWACVAWRKLQGWAAAGEIVFQQASSNTVQHRTLVFPAPAWAHFWTADACAVDAVAGTVKQDTLTPGMSPDKSAVIFLPALQCLCTSFTPVTARGLSLLRAVHGKDVWVSQHLLFAVDLWWKRPFLLFHPITVLSF